MLMLAQMAGGAGSTAGTLGKVGATAAGVAGKTAMGPLGWGMLAAQAVPTAINLAQAISQKKKGSEFSNAQRPQYNIPQGVLDQVNQAKYLAGMRELPGQNLMEGRLGQNTAKGIAEMKNVAANPADLASNVARMYGAQNDAMNNIGIQAGQNWLGQQGRLGQALGNLGQYQDKQWDYNTNQPYQNSMAAASALKEAAFRNAMAGGMNIASGVSGALNMQNQQNMLDKYLGALNKDNTQAEDEGSDLSSIAAGLGKMPVKTTADLISGDAPLSVVPPAKVNLGDAIRNARKLNPNWQAEEDALSAEKFSPVQNMSKGLPVEPIKINFNNEFLKGMAPPKQTTMTSALNFSPIQSSERPQPVQQFTDQFLNGIVPQKPLITESLKPAGMSKMPVSTAADLMNSQRPLETIDPVTGKFKPSFKLDLNAGPMFVDLTTSNPAAIKQATEQIKSLTREEAINKIFSNPKNFEVFNNYRGREKSWDDIFKKTFGVDLPKTSANGGRYTASDIPPQLMDYIKTLPKSNQGMYVANWLAAINNR